MLQKKSPYGINFDYKIIRTSRDIPQGKNKKNSGFSFIEVILAVFLVSSGMIVVMSLMSTSLRDSMDIRNQNVAVLLSQEGVELVRNLRDNNWASGLDSFNGFPVNLNNWCRIDFDDTSTSSNASGILLYSDNTDGTYSHDSGGTATKFRRLMKVSYDNISEKNTATIISIVNWTGAYFSNPNIYNDPANYCTTSNKCTYTTTTLSRWGEAD